MNAMAPNDRRRVNGNLDGISLILDRNDRPIWNMANALTVFEHHPYWVGVLGFNIFTNRRVLMRAIPGETEGIFPRDLTDDDIAATQAWFNRAGFPRASAEIAHAALRKACAGNQYDPLADYLNALTWDGIPRLGGWLVRYCGVEQSDYVFEAGKRWCISAVARGLNPGCKVDHMLVLEGCQGAGKSSALKALAGDEWFTDALPPMSTKDASSYLRGRWIIEVAELEAMRSQVDAVKAFISRQVETFRPAYAREEVSEPRRCVFAGTTNRGDWHKDETGGRRFWPVTVGAVDIPAISEARDQLWAEAVALYRKGERWWLTGAASEEAKAAVASRRPDDPWRSDIQIAVNGKREVCAKDILVALGFIPSQMTTAEAKRVTKELVALGWKREGQFTSGDRKGSARWVPSPGDEVELSFENDGG